MKQSITLTIALVLAAAATTPVFAGPRDHDFAERRDNQAHRIERGIESGQLTRKETKVLKKEQRRIARLHREFREDRHLARREARILERAYDEASRHIRAFKHNELQRRQVRYKLPRDRHGWGDSDRHGSAPRRTSCSISPLGTWIEEF